MDTVNPPAEEPASSSAVDPPAPSKRSLKRAAKQATFESRKLELRAREKQKKKEKMGRLKEQSGAGLEDARLELEEKLTKQRDVKARKAKFRKGLGVKEEEREGWWKGRVVVDLGFDELMTDMEIKSMSTQITYLYNIHTMSQTPFNSLLFTHLNGRLLERLHKAHWQTNPNRWAGTEWWDGKELDQLWLGGAGTTESRTKQEDVVYLTADSENEIDSLEEGTTYVIGGIVDRNRYKDLCLEKAQKLGIRTARLPIGTYLANMPTRKVLTVNQVFEILTSWVEYKDWEKALTKVMPVRKMVESHKKAKKERKGRPENLTREEGKAEATDEEEEMMVERTLFEQSGSEDGIIGVDEGVVDEGMDEPEPEELAKNS